MSELTDAIAAMGELEADPEGARAALGADYDAVVAGVREAIRKGVSSQQLDLSPGAQKPMRQERDAQVRAKFGEGQKPTWERARNEEEQQAAERSGIDLEKPVEGVTAESLVGPGDPALRRLDEADQVQRLQDQALDPSAQSFTKRKDISRPPEFAGTAAPSVQTGMPGPLTGTTFTPGVSGWNPGAGQVGTSRHPITWFEPTLDEFRRDMRGQGWDVDKLDQNSDEYKTYADVAYAQAYDDAVSKGIPITRSAFTKFAQEHPTINKALDAVESALYGAESTLAFGIPSRANEKVNPSEKLARQRVVAEHPVANTLGAIGAAFVPAAPANVAGGAAARGAESVASRLGFSKLATKAVTGGVAGSAAAATQSAGQDAVDMASGEKPPSVASAATRALISGMLGFGLGSGLGVMQRGAEARMDNLRENSPVGPDLKRAEDWAGAHTTVSGGMSTPDRVRALRAQARQEQIASPQDIVAAEAEGPMLARAQEMSRGRQAVLDQAENHVTSEVDRLGRVAEQNEDQLVDSVHLWGRLEQDKARAAAARRQDPFYRDVKERRSMRPVVDEIVRHIKPRVSPTGSDVGDPSLLQRWVPKLSEAVEVPSDVTAPDVIRGFRARRDLDIENPLGVSRAEAEAMGFDVKALDRATVDQGWVPSDRFIIFPRKLSAQEHNEVSSDMAGAFSREERGYRPEFKSVVATMLDQQKQWGKYYQGIMEQSSRELRDANQAVERVGMPVADENGGVPGNATRQNMRGVVSGYGAEGRDPLVDRTLEKFAGQNRPLLKRNLEILTTLRNLGLLQGSKPTARNSWTPGQRSAIRTLLENYGVSNPPATDAELGAFLGQLEASVAEAQRVGEALESVGLPRKVPENPANRELAGFHAKVAGYDPALAKTDPGMEQLQALADAAGVKENLKQLGGLAALDRLQRNQMSAKFFGRMTPTGPGGTMLFVPGNTALRVDAAMRGLKNVTPGMPGTAAGRPERAKPSESVGSKGRDTVRKATKEARQHASRP